MRFAVLALSAVSVSALGIVRRQNDVPPECQASCAIADPLTDGVRSRCSTSKAAPITSVLLDMHRRRMLHIRFRKQLRRMYRVRRKQHQRDGLHEFPGYP